MWCVCVHVRVWCVCAWCVCVCAHVVCVCVCACMVCVCVCVKHGHARVYVQLARNLSSCQVLCWWVTNTHTTYYCSAITTLLQLSKTVSLHLAWIGGFTWKRCINSCSARSSVGDTSMIGDRSVTGDQSAVSGRATRGFVLCSWRRKEHHLASYEPYLQPP